MYIAGDLLREENNRPGSQYGDIIKTCMKEGGIVPMEVTITLLENAMKATIEKTGKKRFLIDGFPRKLDQALKFEEIVRIPAFCLTSCTLFMQEAMALPLGLFGMLFRLS